MKNLVLISKAVLVEAKSTKPSLTAQPRHHAFPLCCFYKHTHRYVSKQPLDSLVLQSPQGLGKTAANGQLPPSVLNHFDAPREILSAQASTAGGEWISPTGNH